MVIGRTVRNVSRENALECVLGLRHRQRREPARVAADRSHALPRQELRHVQAVRPVDRHRARPRQLRIVVRHNGTVWEDFSSADQIWDTATWIHEMSKTATLHPGDVLWMGTEGADGDMVPGDVIEVEISGIGTLRNPIVAEQ